MDHKETQLREKQLKQLIQLPEWDEFEEYLKEKLSRTHSAMEGSNSDELRGQAQLLRVLLNLKALLQSKR